MIKLDVAQKELMEKYYALLKEWNKTHRLTGDVELFWQNIEDSIYPLGFLEPFGSFADVGSGAGFPGMALAIVRPDVSAVLIEPNAKKASFLRFVTIELGLKNVKIQTAKVQDCEAEAFDLIVSRAVSNVCNLLDWTKKLRNKSTKILLYKGEQSALAKDARIIQSEAITRGERIYIYIKECEC